jgi:hypothetical protein
MGAMEEAKAGFVAAYSQRVRPSIAALEMRRILTFVAAGAIFLVSNMAGTGIAGALRGTALDGVRIAFVFIGFFGAIGGPAYLFWRMHRALPRLFFEALALGVGFTLQPGAPFSELFRFQALGLAPLRGQRAVQAVMSAEADGRLIAAAIIQDTQRLGRTRSTSYQGVVVSAPWGAAFPAQVTLLREGWGGAPAGLQDVGLVDARFERRFRVFGSDQVEARVLLDPAVIEEVLQLDEAIGGPQLQCAFAGSGVYIAIRTVNLASGRDAWPRLWSPINREAVVRQLAWDLYWAREAAILLRPAQAWLR